MGKKRLSIIALLTVSFLLLIALCIRSTIGEARRGKVFLFEIGEGNKILTEELAIAAAANGLKKAGVSSRDWTLCEDGRTKAPDGSVDRYLSRNSIDPNRGFLVYSRSNELGNIFVNLELTNRRIICTVVDAK
jgi:hypothetical protein